MRLSAINPARTDGAALIDALLSASRVLVAVSARSLAKIDADVTLPQYRVLVVLVSAGPQRMVDLAQELAVRPSTVTRMCDRLVRKGLVARHERPEDRRAAWVALTPEGRALVAEVMRHRREEIARLVSAASIRSPALLAEALRSLVNAAGELPDRQWRQRWQVETADATDERLSR